MGFLPSCVCVSTIVWKHHMDTHKVHGKKARWELLKNTTNYFEQILEATPCETIAVRPLTSDLKKTSKEDEQDMRDTAGEARTNS